MRDRINRVIRSVGLDSTQLRKAGLLKQEDPKMRKVVAAAALFVGLCLAGTVFAESATKDECVAKCKEAAQLVTDKGVVRPSDRTGA